MTAFLLPAAGVLAVPLALHSLYDLMIGVAGIPRPKPPPLVTDRRRFAILVAAHNEERVIGRCIESLRGQRYPRSRYEVFVVADNCSDRTASEAAAAGAEVFVRSSARGGQGKAAALRWLIAQVRARGFPYDAVCVFDADNVVAADYLEVMNRHLFAGETCIQGYLDTKNPEDTWVSGSIGIAYWTTNRLWQAARHRLGLCCALGGTGFCLHRSLIGEMEHSADCLTEDLDLQMRLVRRGMRVTWAHYARTYDEKPLSLRASCRQRLRWMRGHTDVGLRMFLPLLARCARGDFVSLDAALYCLQPLRLVLGAAVMALVLALLLAGAAPSPFFWIFGATLLPFLCSLAHLCFAGLPALGLVLERVPPRRWKYYPHAFVFGLTWIPLAFLALFTFRRRGWTHTEHTRALDLDSCRRRPADRLPLRALPGADGPSPPVR